MRKPLRRDRTELVDQFRLDLEQDLDGDLWYSTDLQLPKVHQQN